MLSNLTSNIEYLCLYFCKGEDRVVCSVTHNGEEDISKNECKQHLNAHSITHRSRAFGSCSASR